jgi:hypothetical protein
MPLVVRKTGNCGPRGRWRGVRLLDVGIGGVGSCAIGIEEAGTMAIGLPMRLAHSVQFSSSLRTLLKPKIWFITNHV